MSSPSNTPKVEDDNSAYQRYSASKSSRLASPWATRYDPLRKSIMEAWQDAEQSTERKKQVSGLLQHLTAALNQATPIEENPDRKRYKVDAFGSMSWGGCTGPHGDLDLIILDRNLPVGYHPSLWRVGADVKAAPQNQKTTSSQPNPNVPEVYDMEWLSRFLQDNAGMEVRKVIHATAAIVKFKDPASGLECDITTNELKGWYNSRMILAYCEISPFILRPLIHALKLWLAKHGLNDASGTTGLRGMASFCITLMAIAYLQHLGILPNLQANVKAKVVLAHPDPTRTNDSDAIWVSWGREQGHVAHIGFDRAPPASWRTAQPDLNVGDVLRGFFHFFSNACTSHALNDDCFKYKQHFVSVLNGGIVKRRRSPSLKTDRKHSIQTPWKANEDATDDDEVSHRVVLDGKGEQFKPKLWGDWKLFVQDPFLWETNLAASMEKAAVDKFIRAVNRTNEYLQTNGNTTLASLLDLDIE